MSVSMGLLLSVSAPYAERPELAPVSFNADGRFFFQN